VITYTLHFCHAKQGNTLLGHTRAQAQPARTCSNQIIRQVCVTHKGFYETKRSSHVAWTTATLLNALLWGISVSINYKIILQLQSVQNAAARLIIGARRQDHITPVLKACFIGCL